MWGGGCGGGGGVGVGGAPRQPPLQLRRERPGALRLGDAATPLLGWRRQLPSPLAALLRAHANGVSLGPRRRHGQRLLRHLVVAPAEIFPVVHDLLQLPVEQCQHVAVLAAQRPVARGALALRPELGDAIALLLEFLVLLAQVRQLGRGVLLFRHPVGVQLLQVVARRTQVLRQILGVVLGGGQRFHCGGEVRQAPLQSVDQALQLVQLRLFLPPRRLLALQALQVAQLPPDAFHRLKLRRQARQLVAGVLGLRQLTVDALEFLPRRLHRLLRHPQLAFERQQALAPRHPFLPARLLQVEGSFRFAPRRLIRASPVPRGLDTLLPPSPLLLHHGAVRQRLFQAPQLVGNRA